MFASYFKNRLESSLAFQSHLCSFFYFYFFCFKLSPFDFYGLFMHTLLKLALKIILQETELDSKVNAVRRGDNNKQKKKKKTTLTLFCFK